MTALSELTKEDYYIFLHDRVKVVLFSIWLKKKLGMPTKVRYDDDLMTMDISEELASFVMDGSKVEATYKAWLLYCKEHDYMMYVNGYGDRHVLLKNEYTVKTEAATVTIGGTTQQQDEKVTNEQSEKRRAVEQAAEVLASKQKGKTRRDRTKGHEQIHRASDGAGRGDLQRGSGPVCRDGLLF